jgi:hypothetical protein
MIGRIISQRKILEELGASGVGVLHKAEDMKLQRIVTLEFLPPWRSATRSTVRALRAGLG